MEILKGVIGIIWLLSLIFFPVLLIMGIWGVDLNLIKNMFFTDLVIFAVFSILMEACFGNN